MKAIGIIITVLGALLLLPDLLLLLYFAGTGTTMDLPNVGFFYGIALVTGAITALGIVALVLAAKKSPRIPTV